MATLQACILCLETTVGVESFVIITSFWPEKSFAALGSLPISMWHLGRQFDWTISGVVLLNTSGSTWGKIFQHLPILLGFSCHGLLAW
jgi:hypothetical protein